MPYKKADITRELADDIIAKHKTLSQAAHSIVGQCVKDNGQPATVEAVSHWLRDVRSPGNALLIQSQAREAAANKFLKLLDDGGIDPQLVADGEIKLEGGNFKTYGVFAKIKDPLTKQTHIETKSLYSVGVKLSPINPEPKWPVVQPAKPTKVVYSPRPTKSTKSTRTVAIISDLQIGFNRNVQTGELEPMHDTKAIDVAHAIVADLQPDELGYIGDVGDFSSLSTYLQHKEFSLILQPSLDEIHNVFSRFEAVMGDPKKRQKTFVVGGNHDSRIGLYAIRNAKESFGIRRANDPKGWPVWSFPLLTRMDDLKMEWVGEFPGAEKWLTPELVVRHEPPSKSERFDASVIHGHTHKLTRLTNVLQTRHGSKVYAQWDIGCLCRVDTTKDALRLQRTHVPSDRGRVTWAQGFAVVSISPDGHYDVEQVSIKDGKALFRGKQYSC